MIGQDIQPSKERLPGRYLTSSERALWQSALKKTDDLNDYVIALRMMNINAAWTWLFAQKYGLTMTKPDRLENQLLDLDAKVKRVKELVRKVEDLELAVAFRDGDLDIVELPSNLQGIILVAAGVVVLAGLIAALYHYKTEADEIRPKYNNLLKATDQTFCTQGSPDTCAEWKAYKTKAGYTKRQTVAEKIISGIKKPIQIGAKYGTTILIGLVGVALASVFFGRKR